MLQALAPQRPLSLGRLPDTSACVSRGNSDRAPTASSFGIELVDVRDLIASPVDIVPLLILYCFISSNPTARQVGVYWSRRHWWEGTGGCTLCVYGLKAKEKPPSCILYVHTPYTYTVLSTELDY